eukprot:TRINITY_DN6450_c0_g1_i1.p2 TRINITY_DN6450_c0_g1~~TRINITY_DN6450_c0_g1_i1.p2  ORF type:complete len:253 (-),score=95.12 TRINITY_DN6450_c0_g1_i1:89-847(-)
MKIILAFVTLVGLSAAAPLVPTARLVALERVDDHTPPAPTVDPAKCPQCINLMIGALDAFVNAIGNGGILGGCSQLCGYVPLQSEYYVCQALCDAVGIEELIRVLNSTDPDPIYACEEIKVCPISDTAAAKITDVVVDPITAPFGATFWVNMSFTILNTTGTAIVQIWTIPPHSDGKSDISETGFLVETPPGDYRVSFEYATKGDSSQFWPGVYNSTLFLCEGYCASAGIHKHQYMLDQRQNVLFTITKAEE